jgi:hydroxyacylglutathione hydrolase
MGFVNAYIVEGESQNLILVDTGTSRGATKILSYLDTIGKKPSSISHIILTHPDADHSGSAAKLKAITNAKVGIGELDAPRLSGEEKKLKEASGFAGKVITGLFGGFMNIERLKPDIILKDGDTVGPLGVIHTPGHTDGSISVYKPNEALFVGDLLRTDSQGRIKLPASYMSRDMDEVRRSIERISKLEFSMIFPGHGKPILEEGSKKLREFVANNFK